MIIIKDSREKVGAWDFSFIKKCEGQIVQGLKTGDYSIKGMEDIVCIERKKTTGELATNFGTKWPAFCRELTRMSKYKYKYILLEFTLNNVMSFPIGSGIPESHWRRMKLTSKFMISRIEHIKVSYGINIVFCGNKENAQLEAAAILESVYDTEIK
jgi:ERCC4-type nuclease